MVMVYVYVAVGVVVVPVHVVMVLWPAPHEIKFGRYVPTTVIQSICRDR